MSNVIVVGGGSSGEVWLQSEVLANTHELINFLEIN